MLHIVALIILGLLVGLLGRLFHPGRDKMGLLMTILIGVASVLIAGMLIHGFLGFIVAIVIGVVLVAPTNTGVASQARHGLTEGGIASARTRRRACPVGPAGGARDRSALASLMRRASFAAGASYNAAARTFDREDW